MGTGRISSFETNSFALARAIVAELLFGAVAAAVLLLKSDFVSNIFLWGAGDLAQNGRDGVSWLAWRTIPVMAALIASLDPDGMPSMAQDRINQKPTEVEEFSGTIIRLAERHGLLVPTNRWLYDRIRTIEASFGTK